MEVPNFVETIFLDPNPYFFSKRVGEKRIEPNICLKKCLSTVGGPDCVEWHEDRSLQITASKVHSIVRARTPATRYRAWTRHVPVNEAIKHGIDEEPFARAAFEKKTGFKVFKCGTVTKPEEAWASATPDGLFVDKNGDLACLEIKCPVSFKHGNIEANYFLELYERGDGEVELKLKKSSSYYTQVQWQMYCTGAKTNHFYVYTSKDEHHEIVKFDEEFLKDIVASAEKFYFGELMPRHQKFNPEKPVMKMDEEEDEEEDEDEDDDPHSVCCGLSN